jgi:probable F420-dependent oxidoreductase
MIASENCFAGADRGMQVLGGYGYAMEYDMQRYWRDMRLYRVAPINNEMCRNFLAESLGLPRQLELASASERLGFDGVTLPDHVFLPLAPDGRYPYSADGRPPFAAESPWPDPLVMAAAIAARTSTLTLLTAVLVLPMRHPLLVAKTAATVARLAGGRFALGVGAGWQRGEFEALGVDFGARGARMDDAMDAVRAAWTPGVVEHGGPLYRFGPLRMEPKPPPVPILVGGESDAALRRAVTRGDGWVIPMQPLERVPGQLARLRAALGNAGRDARGFRVAVGCAGATGEQIEEILDPLVSDVIVMPWGNPAQVESTTEEKLAALTEWARTQLPRVRAVKASHDGR